MRNSKSAKSWTSERAGRSSTISAPGNERSATAASVPMRSSACMDAWSASERATEGAPAQGSYIEDGIPDRKSTRLNSSHLGISYAVFCLKKKKKYKKHIRKQEDVKTRRQ